MTTVKKKKKKSKILPLVILAIVLVVVLVAGVFLIKKYGPTSNPADLTRYYFLDADAETGREAAAPDELAIVLEDTMLDSERAVYQDGHAYVSQSLITTNIDDRFFWDSAEQVLVVTNATDIIMAGMNATSYTVNGAAQDAGYAIVIDRNGAPFIAMDFVDMYSSSIHYIYDNPGRVYIQYKCGEIEFCETKGKTQIRVRGGVKANVVATVPKGEKLQVINDLDDWLEVVSLEGYVGYVKTSRVKRTGVETVASSYAEPEYTHLSTGSTVNMAWHQMYGTGGNENFYNLVENTAGLDVISPTWYDLYDVAYVLSYADADYVANAHDMGLMVWATFRDTETSNEVLAATFSRTSYRQAVVNYLVNDMINYGIDGINLNLERVAYAGCGDAFIQFVRELSVKCRAAGKYLSCDNYIPYSNNNASYHIEKQNQVCDYVIIMAYDDYLGTENGAYVEAGPNSSLPYLKEIMDVTSELMSTDRLIMALPFYTRFWYRDGDGILSKEEHGMGDARSIVSNNGAGTTWDDVNGMEYANYYSYNGNEVMVWLENASSLDAKCSFLKNYNIAGVAGWALGQEDSDVWGVISSYY